ncbi:ABC transporter ATP-binding protein [Desulfitobacterium sp.]|uniref:ABC transporter ATP-binding protein n=1 Tax=Desulfitobacterium sp. TaxID=49981 RepID=UPI002CC5CB2E|nr:ATP-binding cassette domain-containing protein [Desulfitobacterium sp.]HVJ48555.1 ATP-binding cassette domain-containing protein [Desulfitobacterium sp.]
MLTVNNLTKVFNQGTINEKIALDRVQLHLDPGDFVTVIGSNGAGKSTLMNAIAGTFLPDQGHIILDGKDITKLPSFKRAELISRVFQDPMSGTAASMTIEENLIMALKRGEPRRLRWALKGKERESFREELTKLGLGLEGRLTTKVRLLSGGQRQALTLLMATLKKPRLLLLDEHTAALDPKTAEKVLNLTCSVTEKSHLTTLMITHNLEQALAVGNRTLMMHDGRIILDLKGTDRNNMSMNRLLEMFEKASGVHMNNDRMILASTF